MIDTNIEVSIKSIPNFNEIIHNSMERIGFMLEGKIKENLSGPILNVQTGRLRSSIFHHTERRGDDVETHVGSNVVYLATHEFGAIITPKNANALVIPQPDGTIRLVKQVEIPARKPMETSWGQIKDRAIKEIQDALVEGWNNAN
jgi:phage gpG-like protein|tara:strand:- start:2187 stop:2621 length:435 start_codon:yes stop_codon:yes gene_type:complete